MTDQIRSIRNNNPGNIKYDETPWEGLASPESDGTFCIFRNPYWGVRAMGKVLLTYNRVHDLWTIREIVSRWAPPEENDTESYIEHVSKMIYRHPDDRIVVKDHHNLSHLCEAIAYREAGFRPYHHYVFDAGAKMALEG